MRLLIGFRKNGTENSTLCCHVQGGAGPLAEVLSVFEILILAPLGF